MSSSSRVADRLAGVQAALDLGRSLSSAKGPTLPFSSFENRSLRLAGRANPGALRPSARALLYPGQPLANEVCFFVSFAGSEIPVGSEFDILVCASDGAETDTRAILVGVLPKFGFASLDSVPRGHETICVIQFPAGIPEAVAMLPEAEGWTHDVVEWLGTQAALLRTRPR